MLERKRQSPKQNDSIVLPGLAAFALLGTPWDFRREFWRGQPASPKRPLAAYVLSPRPAARVMLFVRRRAWYPGRLIRSFRDKDTEWIFQQRRVKAFERIARVALRKLVQIDSADELRDLASPPANRLEALQGDRAGQYSIRINDQYRVCSLLLNYAYQLRE